MNADKTISDVHAPVRILIHPDGGPAVLFTALRARLWRVLANGLTLKRRLRESTCLFLSIHLATSSVFKNCNDQQGE